MNEQNSAYQMQGFVLTTNLESRPLLQCAIFVFEQGIFHKLKLGEKGFVERNLRYCDVHATE
jgi:hypothetical protein